MTVPAPRLQVVFASESRTVDPDRAAGLVFGRGAELDIDSNPFLHRRVGRFVPLHGIWWVENLSAWTPLVVSVDGASTLLPGNARIALTQIDTVIRFEAGACNYELSATLSSPPGVPVPAEEPLVDLTATFRPAQLPINDEQRLLIVVLAEARLRNPHSKYELPSNAAAAARLGWSTSKYNRKLDYLCRRLDQMGVSGLRDDGRRTNDRRLHLVDHALISGYICADDLARLDELRPASDAERAP